MSQKQMKDKYSKMQTVTIETQKSTCKEAGNFVMIVQVNEDQRWTTNYYKPERNRSLLQSSVGNQNQPANGLILDFQSPQLGDSKCALIKYI